jgi:hypothetical protein
VEYIKNFTILEYVMLWFFIAGNFTAIHRGIQSWRELREQESISPEQKERAKRFYQRLSEPRSGTVETVPAEKNVSIEENQIRKIKVKPKSAVKKRKPSPKKPAKTRTRRMKLKPRKPVRRVRNAKQSKGSDNKIEWD